MTFFKKYSNNNLLKRKYVENLGKYIEEDNFDNNNPHVQPIEDKIDLSLENLKKVKEKVKKEILNETIIGDPFFDEQLYNELDNLHSYISQFIPNYPKYYDENKKINPKAFLDARDILKNEFPINAEEIINTSTSLSGVMNDTKMNFENGYQIDSDGNIYNPNKEIIFNPKNDSEKVKFLDLLNEKIVTEHGIRIDMPKHFIEENIINNENLNNEFKDKLSSIKNSIKNNNNFASNTEIIEDVYATVNGNPITYENKIFVEMPLENVYMGDIFNNEQEKINMLEKIEKYQKANPNLGICNFKDIPYAELNMKLFCGGGQRGVRPLSSNNISDKDISFAPNGTVYYSGANSTITIRRPGCKSKTYKTGHVCMWSDTNKTGIKTSIIQYIYKFCDTFGLFNANIPMLIGFKRFKVFPGLCIGGLLEMALCGWQEKISSRINDMFQCIPSKIPSDASESIFENETFQHGPSVDNLQELDKIKSCKFGDRYVVDVVDTNISHTNTPACGVFVFDPNNKLSNYYKWRYKVWSGKPFSPNDNNVSIKEFENMYQNPLIQDLLMNTNALGEDSITRKLMSLQYAYMKKQSLLSISDVNLSIDSIIESSIYEVLDKLTYNISNYILLLDLKEQLQQSNKKEDNIPSYGTPISFANKFLQNYSILIDKGILKECPLNKCLKKIYKNESSGNSGGVSTTVITFYDFSGYDPNVYLVPDYNNVEKADSIAFSNLFSPNDELKSVFDNNIQYLNKLGADTKNYSKLKTMLDYINISDNKQALEKNIEDNLRYIKYQLDYDGYDSRAFAQIERRCNYTLKNKKIF